MGKWAKSLFGREKFDSVGFVLAGTIKPEFEKKVLGLFDEVVSSKDAVYHGHLVQYKRHYYPVLTNVYGSPAMLDSITEMHDGGCRNIIFIGYAYGGFKNLDVGSVVLPIKSYHFDGIYSSLDPSRKLSVPDKDLRNKIKAILDKADITYVEGPNISVPAVSFQLPHANQRYREIKPVSLEMELASCFSRAKDIGIRAAGILIISDNRNTSIADEEKSDIRRNSKLKVIRHLIKNIREFNLPGLKTRRKFDIDDHLASIIEDPEDVTNIYKR